MAATALRSGMGAACMGHARHQQEHDWLDEFSGAVWSVGAAMRLGTLGALAHRAPAKARGAHWPGRPYGGHLHTVDVELLCPGLGCPHLAVLVPHSVHPVLWLAPRPPLIRNEGPHMVGLRANKRDRWRLLWPLCRGQRLHDATD